MPRIPKDPAQRYARFSERFSEAWSHHGVWDERDRRDLAAFHATGMAVYPVELRPIRKAGLHEHPLFNLAYAAMQGHDLLHSDSWPLIVSWCRQGVPLSERDRLALASMAVERLENDYAWYQEAQPHEMDARRATAQAVFNVAQDLGWDPRDTLAASTRDWPAFRRAWKGFLLDHPIGPLFRGWEEERILRKALNRQPAPPVCPPRRRL